MVVVEKDNLSNVIETALSQTPSAIGRRLRSEPDLAVLFNVGRWKLRNSLDRLVEKGVLVRRKGSGTYVRKMPETPTDTSRTDLPVIDSFAAKKLFADSLESMTYPQSPFQPVRYSGNLRISLWSSLQLFGTASNQAILSGITRRVAQTRNQLLLNTMQEGPIVMLPIPEIARQLQDNPADGYLVVARWAEFFKQAIGDRQVPVLYFADDTFDLPNDPLVITDTYGAIASAVDIFAREGFKRIAQVGFSSWRGNEAERQNVYELAMKKAGLDYRRSIFVEPGHCLSTLHEILRQSDRPDAIYVSDDTLIPEVNGALTMSGLVPGRDIGIITLNVEGRSLAGGHEWSQLSLDLDYFSQRVVDELLQLMQSRPGRAYTIALRAEWKPGKTHQRA